MRRPGFTLTELMVVLAIIVLLVTILPPSLSRALALSRATVCRNHLHEISTALATDRARLRMAGWSSASDFPSADEWPGIPYSTCPMEDLYLCPEEEGAARVALMGDPLSHLVYRNIDSSSWKPPRNIEIRFSDPGHQGLGNMHLGTRRGSDARGEYIEIGLDDNERVNQTSGRHDGVIRVYLNVKGRVIARLIQYSCGEFNAVLFDGKPLFTRPGDPPGVSDPASEQYGWLGPGRSKEGMEVELTSAFKCSYGMTVGSQYFTYPTHRILVLDYDRQMCDPEDSDTQQLLQDGARHLGRLNLLFADGSVRTKGPTEIDPALPGNERWWRP